MKNNTKTAETAERLREYFIYKAKPRQLKITGQQQNNKLKMQIQNKEASQLSH